MSSITNDLDEVYEQILDILEEANQAYKVKFFSDVRITLLKKNESISNIVYNDKIPIEFQISQAVAEKGSRKVIDMCIRKLCFDSYVKYNTIDIFSVPVDRAQEVAKKIGCDLILYRSIEKAIHKNFLEVKTE